MVRFAVGCGLPIAVCWFVWGACILRSGLVVRLCFRLLVCVWRFVVYVV